MNSPRRLLAEMGSEKRLLSIGILAMGLQVLASLAVPWIVKSLVNRGILGRSPTLVMHLALALVALGLLRAGFLYIQRSRMEILGHRIAYRLRRRVMDHLAREGDPFYGAWESGQLISRTTGDIDILRRVYTFGVVNILSALLTFVGVGMLMLRLSPLLALLTLAQTPFFFLTVRRMQQHLRPAFRATQNRLGELTSRLNDHLTGLRLVRAHGLEPEEARRFEEVNGGYRQAALASARIQATYVPLMQFLPGLSSVIILAAGGGLVVQGSLSLGAFLAFDSYLLLLIAPLRMFGMVLGLWSQALAASDRVYEILDRTPSLPASPNPVASRDVLHGAIDFEHVFLERGGRTVLRDISLQIPAGKTVALVGAAGSGKSSLVQLIPRLLEATSGMLRVDGQDIRTLDTRHLRRMVGYVPDDTFLFSQTVTDNAAFGRPDAGREAIQDALTAAQVLRELESLPDGLLTRLGRGATGLSGGQKQRLALARALLVDPAILLLDDSVSSVDSLTEQRILETLREMRCGRTTVVISQRPRVVLAADRVVVLEGGRIVEEGPPALLLARGGPFSRFFARPPVAEQEVARWP